MSKETTLTIRVDADLRAEFNAAVTSMPDRSSAQVLRAFMRDFVNEHRGQRRAVPSRTVTFKPDISNAERERRQAAADRAQASVELEGYTIPPETLAIAQRFINGEIDMATYEAEALSRGKAAYER